MLPGLVTLTDL